MKEGWETQTLHKNIVFIKRCELVVEFMVNTPCQKVIWEGGGREGAEAAQFSVSDEFRNYFSNFVQH